MIEKGTASTTGVSTAEAADAYAAFAAAYPESELAADAVYREGITRDKAGDGKKADETIQNLLNKEGLPKTVRLMALAWLGGRYLDSRQYDQARPLLDELAAGERTAANLTLAGEADLGSGDYTGAGKNAGDALGMKGVDSCRVVALRARTSIRLKQSDAYRRTRSGSRPAARRGRDSARCSSKRAGSRRRKAAATRRPSLSATSRRRTRIRARPRRRSSTSPSAT